MADEVEILGWEIGTFAVERIASEDGSAAGSSAVWESYCNWCASRKAVPLAFAVFYAEFDGIAEATGIVRRQVGAHVSYEGIRLENGAGA